MARIEDKDLLLQSYAMANRFASHYSAMRTSLAAAAIVLAYGQFLRPVLAKLFGPLSGIDAGDVISAAMAALLGAVALIFNWRFLRRTLVCRAVLRSVECRNREAPSKHDEALMKSQPEARWLTSDWASKWEAWAPVPVEFGILESAFLKKGSTIGLNVSYFYGWGNRACLALCGVIFLTTLVVCLIKARWAC
jgi:hypothetical protein